MKFDSSKFEACLFWVIVLLKFKIRLAKKGKKKQKKLNVIRDTKVHSTHIVKNR